MQPINPSNKTYWKETIATAASATIFATSTVALVILLSSHFPMGNLGSYIGYSVEGCTFIAFPISLTFFRRKIRERQAQTFIQNPYREPQPHYVDITSQPLPIFSKIAEQPILPESKEASILNSPSAEPLPEAVSDVESNLEVDLPIAEQTACLDIQQKKDQVLHIVSLFKNLVVTFYQAFLGSDKRFTIRFFEASKAKELVKHLGNLEGIVDQVIKGPSLIVRFSFTGLSSMVNFEALEEVLKEPDSKKVVDSLPGVFTYQNEPTDSVFQELLDSISSAKPMPLIDTGLAELRTLINQLDVSQKKLKSEIGKQIALTGELKEEIKNQKAILHKKLAAFLDLLFQNTSCEGEKVEKWSDSLFLSLLEFILIKKGVINYVLEQAQKEFGDQGTLNERTVKKKIREKVNSPLIAKIVSAVITSDLVVEVIKKRFVFPEVDKRIDSSHFPAVKEKLKEAIKGLIDLLVEPLLAGVYSNSDPLRAQIADFFELASLIAIQDAAKKTRKNRHVTLMEHLLVLDSHPACEMLRSNLPSIRAFARQLRISDKDKQSIQTFLVGEVKKATDKKLAAEITEIIEILENMPLSPSLGVQLIRGFALPGNIQEVLVKSFHNLELLTSIRELFASLVQDAGYLALKKEYDISALFLDENGAEIQDPLILIQNLLSFCCAKISAFEFKKR